jgi:AraC family transcriptional regulator
MSVVTHERPREIPEHSHQAAYFTLLLGGTYHEEIGSERFEYGPLSAVYHPPGMTHRDAVGASGGRFFLVEVAEGMIGRDGWHSAGVSSVRDLSGGTLVWTLLRMFLDFERAVRTPLLVEERLAGMLNCLQGHDGHAEGAAPAWLSRIDEMIAAEFREPLYLGRLAREAGVHPVHLSRVYRQHRHRTIRDTLHRLRILEACRLFAGGEQSLAEIAQATGFSDQSHLSNVCRRLTGRAPARLRRGLVHDVVQCDR